MKINHRICNLVKYVVPVLLIFIAIGSDAKIATESNLLYTYKLSKEASKTSYDETMLVACIQGIVNRKEPSLYVLSDSYKRPEYWLDIFSAENGWLAGRKTRDIADLDALVKFAGKRIKGVIIWDPQVPASINVATTIAGIEDGIVLSPEFAEKYQSKWNMPIIKDLRGMFTGKETGSKKNDAYRWAVREYLNKGLCSSHLLCLYEDSFTTRSKGDVGYVITRDWAVKNRSFVYDLSPWGDEIPSDDPGQKMGTDLKTYKVMLKEILKQTAGKKMTEVAGFFAFSKYSNVPGNKSKHEPVPTEWETVHIISPYNCYQNTVASSCYNQSVHSQAPFTAVKQEKPAVFHKPENKTYICILMADYDSATPLYDFMPKHWDDKRRGTIPLLWGINPNLVETFPDIIQHIYRSKSKNDYFAADASAAGYMNPNQIKKKYLPLFIGHNKRFYEKLDMTLSPMVLDFDEPTADVKDAFTQFSPDGFATIVIDMHKDGGKLPKPQVWKGMPVMELINSACNFSNEEQTAKEMSDAIPVSSGTNKPGFHFFRIVWTSPGQVIDAIEVLKKKRPDLDIEVTDPYLFFNMFKNHYSN
ncbi:GxGYxYP domain-containing protein [Pedobacter sp. B4-66]|uniref:GxGYxYP domain-containing protein n=1 Tax=Pedobacter sp. B4-66 TaxID=2817280 RepID=UPI001BDAFAC9|nr:GxGYxYP domain-containing protein [Pedobacter sp. B4-66]